MLTGRTTETAQQRATEFEFSSELVFAELPEQQKVDRSTRRISLSVANDIPDEKFIEIDLGYTIIYVLPAHASKPSVKWLLTCCPCLYGGLGNALRMFSSNGAFKTFIVISAVLEIVVFAVEIIVNGGFEPPSVNPLLGPSSCTLQRMQARFTTAIVHRKQVWRLVTPIFLHGGSIHLALNIYSQLSIGIVSEYKWGTKGMVFVYLIAGITGNIVSAIGNPGSLSVGASGAIMGITGWQAAHLALTWPHAEPNFRTTELAGILVALACLVVIGAALPDRIDNWTHGGGFFAGAALGLFTFRKYCLREWQRRGCFAAGLMLPAALVYLLVHLFSSPFEMIVMADCPLLPE